MSPDFVGRDIEPTVWFASAKHVATSTNLSLDPYSEDRTMGRVRSIHPRYNENSRIVGKG